MPTPELAPNPPAYNPALDGLRGIAVVLVMLVHAGVPGFGSGVFGVDLFFVLSGYLVTALLVRGIRRRQPLGVFYWHRFLRLAPPLIAVCAALLAAAPLFGMSSQAVADSLASLLYVSDWTTAFRVEGIPSFLNNTWSLAVEEQFYLLWPLLLLGLWRLGGIRFAFHATLGLLAVTLAWQAWMWWTIDPGPSRDRIYFAFDTRCAGLLIGCATALAAGQRAQARRFLCPLSLVAAIGFAAMVAVRTRWTPWTCFAASVAAALVIADLTTNRSGPVHFVLRMKGPVAMGRISYAVYLWHMPVLLIVGQHVTLPKAVAAPLGIGLTLVLATASFFLIEQPARRLRDALPVRSAARAGRVAAAVSLVGMFAGVGIFWQADIVNLVDPKPVRIVAYGPSTLHRGETFNVQPDGSSVIWIRTSRSTPPTVRVKVGPSVLETNARGKLITAVLPQAIRDRVGSAPISIIGVDGGLLADPVRLEVSP